MSIILKEVRSSLTKVESQALTNYQMNHRIRHITLMKTQLAGFEIRLASKIFSRDGAGKSLKVEGRSLSLNNLMLC